MMSVGTFVPETVSGLLMSRSSRSFLATSSSFVSTFAMMFANAVLRIDWSMC
jgi:hypothetical protein